MKIIDSILEDLKEIREFIPDSNSMLFLVERTDSRKFDKIRRLKKANIEDEAKNFFVSILSEKVNSIIDVAAEFQDYFRTSINEQANLYLEEISRIPVLPHLIEQVKQYSNLEALTTLDDKSLSKYQGFGVELNFKNRQRMLYFSKFDQGAKLAKSKYLLSYVNGIFSKVEGNLIRFNENIDFIYYYYTPRITNSNPVEKILILNRTNTELILDFKEMFRNETQRVFRKINDFPLLSITENVKEAILNDTNFIKRITIADDQGLFNDLSIQQFKKAFDAIDGIKYKINGGRIVITSKDEFIDILDVLERNHVIDLQNDNNLFKTKAKKPIKRKVVN